MKKFYLTVDHRKLLIERLLRYAADLEEARDKGKAANNASLDIVEASIQEHRMLADLFAVEEHEL